jgi:hypothetical protein
MGIIENTINEVSEKNSTTIPLTANSTYVGESENILPFAGLELNIYSTANSAVNGITLICGQDKDLVTGIYTITDTYTINTEYHRVFPLKGKYMQLQYTNSNTDQTEFKLQAIKTNHPPNDDEAEYNNLINKIESIDTNIDELDTNINSNLNIINTTLLDGITVTTKTTETQLDAFGRLRISNPETIFENTNIYSKNSEYVDEQIIGVNATATYQLSNSAVILSTQNSGDNVIRQSHQYMNYQPGKSLLIFATGVLNPNLANQSNVSTHIGYFDDENGVYFKHNNNITYVAIRSSTSGSVESREIPQTEWNIDKMNGSGPSGITLDVSKTQIFYIDIEWLGVGTVRTGLVIDGIFYLIHKFHHANIRDNVYMTTPNLPLRYQIIATGSTNTQGSMIEICGTVISEGGFAPLGIIQSIIRPTVLSIAKNTESAILAIRLKDSFKRAYNRIGGVQVLVNDLGNDRVIYHLRLFKNVSNIATLFSSGSTFTSFGANSIMEATVNPVYAANAITNLVNRNIHQGFAVSSIPEIDNSYNGLFLSSNIAGVRDILVLSVESLNNATSVFGLLNWIEHI